MQIVAFILLIISGILGLILWLTKRRSKKAIAEITQRIQDLTDKNRELSHYDGILELDREIERRRCAIDQAQQRAEQDIQLLRQEIEADVQQQKKASSDLKRETKERQAQILNSASQEAARIVAEANKRAENLAGDAMNALRNSKQL